MSPEARACAALKAGKRLEFRYDGFVRVVEVHAVGLTKDGALVMSAWQVRGGSVSKAPTGWKLMRFDKIMGLALLDEPSAAPRPGYVRGDNHIRRLLCQL